MSHLKKILDETFGKKKPKQVEVSLERLTPPRAPKPIPPNLMKSIMSHEIEPMIKGGKRVISSEQSVEQAKAESERRSEVSESQEITDSKLGIDPFVWLSSNHSFQMVLYEFMKKFAPGLERIKTRGTKKVLRNSFSKVRQDLMKELKQVLELRNNE